MAYYYHLIIKESKYGPTCIILCISSRGRKYYNSKHKGGLIMSDLLLPVFEKLKIQIYDLMLF